MTGNGAVFNLRRSFANRDGINDLTVGLSAPPESAVSDVSAAST